MEAKEYLLLECRKLINILETWGNTLVPPIPGQNETTAHNKLLYNVEKLKSEHGLTEQQIEDEISQLT